MIEKFPPTKNCTVIEPPQLNSGIIDAIDDTVKMRDDRIAKKQQKITACLSACGLLLDLELAKKEESNKTLPILSDIVSLLADLQYGESVIRKSIIIANVNPSLRTSLMSTSIDEFLFGENLDEAIKSAQALETTAKKLKNSSRPQGYRAPKNFKAPPRRSKEYSSTSSGRNSQRKYPNQYYRPRAKKETDKKDNRRRGR